MIRRFIKYLLARIIKPPRLRYGGVEIRENVAVSENGSIVYVIDKEIARKKAMEIARRVKK